MTYHTIICGLALAVIGVYGFLQGEENAENDYKAKVAAWEADGKPDPAPVKKDVKTALIPAGFGCVLILCGVVVIAKPTLRKHVMHFAAMVGVLGAIGGFVPIIRGGDFDLSKLAVRNGMLMTIVCVIFVVFCVKSFIEARKARGTSGV
jgi:hypothetical protein